MTNDTYSDKVLALTARLNALKEQANTTQKRLEEAKKAEADYRAAK